MFLIANQRTVLSKVPIALLAFQSVLTCPSFSTSMAAASNTPQFSKFALSKMSNGEGYVQNVSPRATKLIQDSIDLFSAKPSHEIFKRSWTPDSVFEDPLCYAKGERQYKGQWWGLAAAFSKCDLKAWHVTKDEPTQVNYVQRVAYTFKGFGWTKEIISTISMKLNEDGKVIHMQDRWDHQDPPANFIAWPLRRFNALVVPLFVTIPSEDKAKPGHADL